MMRAACRSPFDLCRPALLGLSVITLPSSAAAVEDAGQWSHYGATAGGIKYSPLDQIDRGNVGRLALAWSYRTGELERRGEAQVRGQSFETTPIIAGDSLVFCTAYARVVALDPASGAERWVFEPAGARPPPTALWPKCRGVAQWQDPQAPPDAPCRHRILWGSWDFKAYAIDALTGRPCEDFGAGGRVVLDPGTTLDFPAEVQIGSPPAIVGDVAVFGSIVADNLRVDAPSGRVRALDVRSGRLRWEFDPIPRDADDPAAATWGGDSRAVAGHANVWSIMSVDAERDLVFLPTSSPGPDFYGGLRAGENRYANSLVALRGATGEVVWHFQTVHHDLWDYDHASQPILVDLPRDGAMVPAVVQLTKQALVFVLHRETGAPLFPVEERPVPTRAVAGEWVSPTQPYPLAPPPLTKHGLWPEDAWGFTPIDRWLCRRQIERLRHGPAFMPPSLEGSTVMPATGGGVNWGGGAWDPERQLLITPTQHVPVVLRLVPQGSGAVKSYLESDVLEGAVGMPQRGAPYAAELEVLSSPLGAPCTAPPWGRLTAVDLARGTIRWQVPLGTLEKLMPLPIPLAWGTPYAGGPMISAGGLAFIGATLDDKFRAFDVETGEVLWETDLPAGGQATPMSYAAEGRQYVVIAAGGHAFLQTTPGDWLLAFALPRR
jgi:quinoprotein glucose dehydrogenase